MQVREGRSLLRLFRRTVFRYPQESNMSNGKKASALASSLIEEQLRTLSIAIAALAKAYETGEVEQDYLDRVLHHRKLRLVKTASGGNIVADKAENPDKRPELVIELPAISRDAGGKYESLRVMVGNSLVTVSAFMKLHDMLDMRTPEFQFLGHVVDAILNANTFRIPSGYMPVASFDGLIIDEKLNGVAVFSEGTTPGFMEFGDALALLHWLSRYLHGERAYVSGGDAG
jgi:hypothetical protein